MAVDAALVSRFENGKQEPSALVVDAFGEEFGVGTEFFFHPVLRVLREEECSYRHLRSATAKEKARLLARGTFVAELLDLLRQDLELPALDLPRCKSESIEDAERAAKACREHWSLGSDVPIRNTIRVAEHAGIPVLRILEASDRVDAFSHSGDQPVIVLNTKKGSATRARFNLAHEIGHLVMHYRGSDGTKEDEAMADRFASAFLLPRDGFAHEFRYIRGRNWWPHLFELKQRWGVSLQAIVRRGYDLGLLGAIEYRKAYKHISYKGWLRGEPMEPQSETPSLVEAAVRAFSETVGTVADLLDRLGWGASFWKRVSGMDAPSASKLPPNVTSIGDYVAT